MLNVQFDNENICLYGLRLFDILFSQDEQAIAQVKCDDQTINTLERNKIDIIKSLLYLKNKKNLF